MAVLSGPLPPDVITTLAHVLDYAVWRGVPYVRSWPSWKGKPRTPAVQAAGAIFADYARRVAATDPTIVAAIRRNPGNETWTWKDMMTSAIYGRFYT